MRRALGLAAALLSVLLLAAVALVAVLSWVSLDLVLTPYKEQILRELSTGSGLRVEVSGALVLRLGPELRLRVRGLTLTNPTAAASPLLRAERATLTVATLPLLRGRLEPRDLDLAGARLDLTRDADGRPNWELPAPTPAADRPAAVLDGLRLRLRSSRAVYRDRRTGRVLRLGVHALEARRSGEVLALALDGDLDGEPVRLSGHTAPLGQILAGAGAGDAPVPIDLRGQLLGLDLRADGTLALPGTAAATRATLTLKAKTLQGLSPWLGQDAAALGPVDARMVLDGADGRYALAPLAVRIGPARADGQARLDLKGRRPALDLDLSLAELDLRPFLPEGEAAPASTPGQAPVFSEAPLSLGWMDAADVQARVRVSNLIGGRLSATDLDLTATLAEGRLQVAGTGKAQDGRALTLDLGLDTRGAEPSLDLDLRGDKLMIAPLLAGTGAEGLIRGDLDARAKLRASGPSEAAMAASLAGDLMLLVQGAEAQARDLDRLGGGARAILGQILTPQSSMARIDCGLVALNFEQGRTEIKGVIDTPNSIVTGQGSLDLARESIELRLVPQPKGVTLSVAAPVMVSGPLTAPDYRIEAGGLLVSLSELAARIAVPQLLLVDTFGQAVAGSPCGQILAGKIPSGAEYGPLGETGEAAEAVLEGPAAVAKGVGGVVKEAGHRVMDAGGAVVEGAGGLFKGIGGLLKGTGEVVDGAVQPEPSPESAPGTQP